MRLNRRFVKYALFFFSIFVVCHFIFPATTTQGYRLLSSAHAKVIHFIDVRTGIFSQALELPAFDPTKFGKHVLPIPSTIYDAAGTKIGCFATEQRIYIHLDEILKRSPIVQAILASEDAGFSQHGGYDISAIARAAIGNITGGRVKSGASTLTMQLVKNLYLTNEKSYTRKAREALLATYIEANFTKDEILEMYLNFVNFGGTRGIQAAAQSTFGVDAVNLSPAQAAFIAGLINYPNIFQLHGEKGERSALARKNRVLARMYDNGMISIATYLNARQDVLTPKRFERACVNAEPFVHQEVNRQLGVEGGIALAKVGYTIHTTIKEDHQRALERACNAALEKYLIRHPDRRETIRCQAIAVEVVNGNVTALVPGQDPKRDKYSGVTQAVRQPGSAFKPILYTALLEKLFNDTLDKRDVFCRTAFRIDACLAQYEIPVDPLSGCTLLDIPTPVPSVVGWKDRIVRRHTVKNYPYENRPQYRGLISCELALAESRNTSAMQALGKLSSRTDELARWDDGVEMLVEMAQRLGIETPLRRKNIYAKLPEDREKFIRNYTVAIGSGGVTMWDMAQVFIVFVNGGISPQISIIAGVADQNGNPVDMHRRAPKKVLEPEVAWGVLQLLAGVVDDPLGTAHSLRQRDTFPNGALCGKTGTATNADTSATDVWFIGCTPEYLVVARLNNINKTGLGKKETGGRNALLVFKDWVATLHLNNPHSVFKKPVFPRRGPRALLESNAQ